MTSKSQICTWDFTLPEDALKWEEIDDWLKNNCKKWDWQLEKGSETDYTHYQGRISLKVKTRSMIGKLDDKCHWSATSKENADNHFYVTKEETRIRGPWSDRDAYIPRQIREIEKLHPWQQSIIDDAEVWNTRTINLVYCPGGNTGKSTLAGWVRAYKLGRVLPPVNDYKDLLRMVYGIESSKLYIFDMPRSMKKEKLCGFFAAIETIKDGYAYDDRYEFKEKNFDCPNIWIFANVLPNGEYLSQDRWKYWVINKDLELKPHIVVS